MNEFGLNLYVPQTLELLKSRRSGSAKAMTGPGPSADQIRVLISCAARVPDHGKLTPWRFIIFSGEARSKFGEHLAQAFKVTEPEADPERLALERNRLLRAPVVIAAISNVRQGVPIPEWEQILSAGASCQTLCLAAHAMGFVTNWITEWYAYDPHIRQALGLDKNERVAGFIYIGHPVEPLVDRPRPPFDRVATYYPSI